MKRGKCFRCGAWIEAAPAHAGPGAALILVDHKNEWNERCKGVADVVEAYKDDEDEPEADYVERRISAVLIAERTKIAGELKLIALSFERAGTIGSLLGDVIFDYAARLLVAPTETPR